MPAQILKQFNDTFIFFMKLIIYAQHYLFLLIFFTPPIRTRFAQQGKWYSLFLAEFKILLAPISTT